MRIVQTFICGLFFSLLLFSCYDEKKGSVTVNQEVQERQQVTEEQTCPLENYLLNEEENPERLKELLEQGEDPNLVFFFHNTGGTGDDITALMATIIQNRYKDSDILLENGADIDKKAGTFQNTALGFTTSVGTIKQMEYLLRKGADPDIPISDDGKTEASNGATPLIEAVTQNNCGKSQLLLQYGSNPNMTVSENGKVSNSDGSSALMIACINNNFNISKLLLDAGADPNKSRSENGKTIENDGSSPLSSAIYNENLELVKLLLKYGADPNTSRSDNAKNDLNDGTTVLMEAVVKNNLKIVKALIEAGADVNIPRAGNEEIKSHDGAFPLTLAVQERNIEIVKYLLANGANVNQRREDSSEITSLMTAVFLGDLNIVKELIGANADINMSSNKVGTALDIAMDYGQDEIAEYLKKHGAVRAESYSEKNN